MKSAAWVTLSFGLALAALAVLAGPPVASGPPANDQAPLKNQQEPGKKTPVADNQACFVCHANYDEEEMADQHAKANVGCTECHGPSTAHRNDENNITPPDRMFPKEAIDPDCVRCHDTHDAPARKVIARWQQRSLGNKDPKEMVCTDCHGEHRLAHRTVRWDKKTGKLIPNASAPGQAAAEGTKPKPAQSL